MKNFNSVSTNATDDISNPLHPHPPSVPCHNRSESISRTRQRRYMHQISEQRNEMVNLDCREIKSAGSNSMYSDKNPERQSFKSKISSAPSPRSRTIDYRSSTVKREKSGGLYTFDSVPSLITEKSDTTNMPRTKRKENSSKTNVAISGEIFNEPNLPSLSICKSMRPCKSAASPVTSIPFTLRVSRRSLQQVSKEKLLQLSRKSMQNSFCQSKRLENLSDIDCSFDAKNKEPINLTQYKLPNDVSESFEERILASLVAQNAHECPVANPTPTILPQIVTSTDFSVKHSEKITPRTEALLMCGSYSDEESSATTTGLGTNRQGSFLNCTPNALHRHGMHNEWKHLTNCSQDTSRSIDFINSITDSFCGNSALLDDSGGGSAHKSSRYQDYLLVHYIPDFGCFYDPETGIFYESTL